MYTIEEMKEIFSNSYSYTDACRKLKFAENRHSLKKVKELIKKHRVDTSHFDKYHYHKINVIEKECPICGELFTTSKGSKKEKTTCTRACANVYFRSGKNNGNYSSGNYSKENSINGKFYGIDYRNICFSYYDHQCALCEWSIIVDVHHIDLDSSNNDISNLVPLCPNHHRMLHMNEYLEGMTKEVNIWKKNYE